MAFFAALQGAGAVPEVRKLAGLPTGPTAAVVDVQRGVCFPLCEALTDGALREFWLAFRCGKLAAAPLGSLGAGSSGLRRRMNY